MELIPTEVLSIIIGKCVRAYPHVSLMTMQLKNLLYVNKKMYCGAKEHWQILFLNWNKYYNYYSPEAFTYEDARKSIKNDNLLKREANMYGDFKVYLRSAIYFSGLREFETRSNQKYFLDELRSAILEKYRLDKIGRVLIGGGCNTINVKDEVWKKLVEKIFGLVLPILNKGNY